MPFDLVESSAFTGPRITAEMIRDTELATGIKLPSTYIALLEVRNGGVPQARCFPTTFSNSWAEDHIEILAIRGIGGTWGIESQIGGSAYLIQEWGYPNIGVVICEMPSGGHDAVMLDYSESGANGEPTVAYIDEDRVPRTIASSFHAFISGLYYGIW